MRALIVYSSRAATGNTKKLAEAIKRGLGDDCDIFPAVSAPDPSKYDFIMMGFGVYRGWPDGDLRAWMTKCRGKDAGLFLTLGAWPDSEHAHVCMGRAEGLVDSCRVRARFKCHGRLDPASVERMKQRPAGSAHCWDEERSKRVTIAESHPDESDMAKAVEIFKAAWDKVRTEKSSPHSSGKEKKEAVVMAAFGSSVESALSAYTKIESEIAKANPGLPVFRAFTSEPVRRKLAERGVKSGAPRETLQELSLAGFTDVRVVPVQMAPGEEFHKLAREVSSFSNPFSGFRSVSISRPPLASEERLRALADGVMEIIPKERKASEAVVLMGHGNAKGNCGTHYQAAALELAARGKNIFLACVEGRPCFDDVFEKIKARKIKKAWLMPFMITAGDHAVNDLAGGEPDSWKSRLEAAGVKCAPVLKGLGEYDSLAGIFAGVPLAERTAC
jgi:sirohydrochlorin cobaltochelatase